MIMACRDREGWFNFVSLDGRVEDKKQRDEMRWEIIIRNWDFRELCVRVNLPCPIRQVGPTIQPVITPIWGLLNPIGQVVPLISQIRSYSPYCSHLHPTSLFLVYNCSIIAEPKVNSSLSISMPWSWVNTKYSIHRVQHPPRIICLPVILTIMRWPLNVHQQIVKWFGSHNSITRLIRTATPILLEAPRSSGTG